MISANILIVVTMVCMWDGIFDGALLKRSVLCHITALSFRMFKHRYTSLHMFKHRYTPLHICICTYLRHPTVAWIMNNMFEI